jgi:DNA-binding CsgD family transcriptional regulator
LGDAHDHAALAVELADDRGGPARHKHPRIWLGSALASLDRLDEAVTVLRTGRHEAELLGTAWSAPLWHFYLASVIADLGDLDGARAEAEAGVRRAHQLTAVQLAIPLHGLLARVAAARDEVAEASHQLRQLRRLLDDGRTAAPEDLAWASGIVNEAARRPGDALAALADIYDQMPQRLLLLSNHPGCGPTLVRIALAGGDLARAQRAASASAELARRNPAVAAVTGAAAHAQGLLDQDPAALREAVRLLDHSPRLLDQAQAREDCARALHTNDRTAAIELVESAIALYQRCGAKLGLKRATKLLRLCGVRRAVAGDESDPPASVFGMTATELKVAQLATEGLTNREIAERMYISRHTVDTHLRAIFRKTGVKNRAGLGRTLPPPAAP